MRDTTWRDALYAGGLAFLLHACTFFLAAHLLENNGASMQKLVSETDQAEYVAIAHTMIESGRFAMTATATPEIFRTPGYPTVVALVHTLFPKAFFPLYILHAMFTGAVVSLLCILAAHVGLQRRAQWATAAILTLSSGPIMLTVAGLGSDILYTLLQLAGVVLLVSAGQQSPGGLLRIAGVGVTLGLATLVRPVGILASIPILLATSLFAGNTVRTRAAATAVALGAFAIVIVPWVARNNYTASLPIFSSVPTFNFVYYNIPGAQSFAEGIPEDVAREKTLQPLGTSDPYTLRSPSMYTSLASAERNYLSTHAVSYGLYHLYRTIPFFFGSGFNVAHALLAEQAPTLRLSIFPDESMNLTEAITRGDWSTAIKNVGSFWFVTLERLVWCAAIILTFAAPLLARGRARFTLLLGAIIVATTVLLTSPVTQARYRIPAEPFIWIGAVYSLATALARTRKFWGHFLNGESRGIPIEVFRYGVVSAAALLADVLFLALLVAVGLPPVVAATVSFLVGLCIVYTGSVRWVFSTRTGRSFTYETLVFAGVGLVGLIINDAVIALLALGLGMPVVVAKSCAVPLTFAWNFLARKRILFS